MHKDFENKVALVTGGSRGIGRAAVLRFAEGGAKVAIAYAGNDAAASETAQAATGAGAPAVHLLKFDVADPAACAKAVEETIAKLGALHVLVNNAGRHTRGGFGELADADLAAVVDVNLRAPIVLSRRALPHLRASGRGAIVNVASIAGMVPTMGSVVYSATKFGLRAFSLALADELRGSGVTVSCVSPGPVDTGFIMSELETVSDLTMSQPLSSADDIAALVVACALDGRPERVMPRLSGALATAGYLAPGLRRVLLPVMARRGRRNKQKLRERGAP